MTDSPKARDQRMSDLAKARKFAEDYVGITNVVFEHDPAEVMILAKEHLALLEAYEIARNAIRQESENGPCRQT